MMKRWAVAGVGLGIAAAALVHAPAAWIAAALAGASDSRVQLIEPRGTVWHGEGRLLVGEGAGSPDARVLPGRVYWTLGWSAGALQLLTRADCCAPVAQQLRLVPSWGGYTAHLADGSSQWPAALLSALGAPWNTVQPEGELQLRTRGVSVEWSDGQAKLLGQVQVDALAMASRLSTVRPVGSYRVTLTGPGGSAMPTLQLQTLEGPLRLQGSGQRHGARWRFTGEASADPQSESALGNLLNMVGRRQGNKSLLSLG